MNTAGKLSAYGVALALVAGGAWAVGTAVGPFAGAAMVFSSLFVVSNSLRLRGFRAITSDAVPVVSATQGALRKQVAARQHRQTLRFVCPASRTSAGRAFTSRR